MKHVGIVGAALAAIGMSLTAAAQQSVTLNVVTADDQNMVDYARDYLGPMFDSQTALAYNRAMVSDTPITYDTLENWVQVNPKKLGYNGIKGGMSGVAFVVGWIYAHSDTNRLMKGPYDRGVEKSWDPILARLAAFNKLSC
jgi:ABC-type uncharacterized transport system YnjBCD substrate-binding protein